MSETTEITNVPKTSDAPANSTPTSELRRRSCSKEPSSGSPIRKNLEDPESSEDDHDSSSDTSYLTTRTKSSNVVRSKHCTNLSKGCEVKQSCFTMMLRLAKAIIILAVFVLLILLSIGFLLSKLEFHCQLEKLSPDIYSNIYGQELAIQTTLRSVTNFCKDGSYNKPLVLVFWGQTGVGKTAFASIFMHHFDAQGQIVPSEHFKVSRYKDWAGDRISNKPFVYAIDDIMSLHEMHDISANIDSFQFPLILVLTTSMESNRLNNSFIEWSTTNGNEADFVYRGQNPSWWTAVENLQPVLVPFLPLSRATVKLCIEKTLNRLRMKFSKDDVEKIATEYEYFHNGKRLFSKIGCKRVNDKIFSVLSP